MLPTKTEFKYPSGLRNPDSSCVGADWQGRQTQGGDVLLSIALSPPLPAASRCPCPSCPGSPLCWSSPSSPCHLLTLLLYVARKLLGERLFNKLMKMTFYGHFVAGEDQESIQPLIRHNKAFGVGTILDYGVEEDLGSEEAEHREMESCTSAAERDGSGTNKQEKQYQAHRAFGDRRHGVISACTYFYANEAKCDSHMETLLSCIEASGAASDDGFLAIKLTLLGRPQFLLQFSDVLTKWRCFFHQMAVEHGQVGLAAMDTKLEVAVLQESITKMDIASRAEIEDWFPAETLGVSGTVDLLDWNSLINSRTKLSKHLVVPNAQTGQLEPLLSQFTEEEELQMTRMLQRMDVLAKKATEVGVRLMVDAEQTYFQPAISRLTQEMQRRFNVERPLIFSTHQCYLKDAYDNVTLDVELARREGWCFGSKLVRGAYMAQERARAAEIGYEDPINPTYEATNAMYHRCLDHVLEELKHNTKAKVMVATHNEDSVRFTLRRMEELCLHPAGHQVYFGQLLGMCDQISFPLGQAGYPVYKYMPYGPVMDVLPYLSRRALENSSLMKGARRERQLLWLELFRRLRTGSFFHRPA
ncbi:proline dehydrogenase 1, mitochondrial-like isoform X2 [Sapajus apella]|uniref:Proline dehydrogenase n=1 Tax=Sapajus apella TaxID=9515 RepID=A0A6J3H7D3_SAPAP|nr:proline dehydrogenase 1, mitochondrial-like isoform X2 [Sapajus apella]